MIGSQRKSRNDGDIDRVEEKWSKRISAVNETKRGWMNKIESVKTERGVR